MKYRYQGFDIFIENATSLSHDIYGPPAVAIFFPCEKFFIFPGFLFSFFVFSSVGQLSILMKASAYC
jgi:hypothetical protein